MKTKLQDILILILNPLLLFFLFGANGRIAAAKNVFKQHYFQALALKDSLDEATFHCQAGAMDASLKAFKTLLANMEPLGVQSSDDLGTAFSLAVVVFILFYSRMEKSKIKYIGYAFNIITFLLFHVILRIT